MDYCAVTECQYEEQVCKLFKIGELFKIVSNEDSNLRKLISAVSAELYKVRQYMCHVRNEANPCTSRDNIMEWASIFGLNQCINDDQIDSNLICEFFNNRGSLTIDWLKRLVEIEGYTVEEIIVHECEPVTETVVGFTDCYDLVSFAPAGGDRVYAIHNKRCERLSKFYPCANCCINEELAEEELFDLDPCDIPIDLGECRCSGGSEGCKKFGFDIQTSRDVFVTTSPYTITIKIKEAYKCANSIFKFGGGFGGMLVSDKLNEKLCLVENFVPVHYNIKYVFCA